MQPHRIHAHRMQQQIPSIQQAVVPRDIIIDHESIFKRPPSTQQQQWPVQHAHHRQQQQQQRQQHRLLNFKVLKQINTRGKKLLLICTAFIAATINLNLKKKLSKRNGESKENN